MVYIIVDLEATCWENKENSPNEIIEIGAVCINQAGEWVDQFDTFVQPKVHPVLSEFCTSLTSIRQADVDEAPTFPVALEGFQEWIQTYTENSYMLCSWGYYDQVQFKDDCLLHGLAIDWLQPHISLKHQYANLKNLRRPIGMKKALQKEGIALEGTHHRGIDDAINTTKIFLTYLDFWEMPAKS